VPRGGTGQSSFSSGNILYGNGTDGLSSSSALNYDGTTLDVTGDINYTGDLRESGTVVISGGVY
jgi:glutamate synthase domain-containing protein 3